MNTPDLSSEITEILNELQAQVIDGFTQPVNGWTSVKEQANKAILEAVARYVEELIGEDETEKRASKAGMNDLMYLEYLKTTARNELRASMRQQLQKLRETS